MINHEDLLSKYIELVEMFEGVSFVSEACEEYGFSKEEQEELVRLSEGKAPEGAKE